MTQDPPPTNAAVPDLLAAGLDAIRDAGVPVAEVKPLPAYDDGERPDADKVRDALSHIDPGCDYMQWIRIGMALHEWDGAEGLGMWDEWSKGSEEKYKADECSDKWSSFTEGGGITIATLFGDAMEGGWQPAARRNHGDPVAYLRIEDPVAAARSGKPLACTDVGNAERFAWICRKDVHYDRGAGAWRVWDGRRWVVDEPAVERRAMEVVRGIRQEADAAPAPVQGEPDMRAALFKHALASEKLDKIKSMLALARSMPGVGVPVERWDAHPWLLNVSNGTIDLKTGELRPHRREDLMTKLAPVEYDPKAHVEGEAAGLLRGVLEKATGGDRELQGFLQRAAGYSLTGSVEEEKLFFVHGVEATAKSTFLESMKAMLGDYAATADFSLLVKRQNGDGGPREDIARLHGKRFVASVEVAEGKQLAEEIVKSLTGNEKIAARHLYQSTFEYQPQFKLWMGANHAPRVSEADGAMWRRILRIPFDRQIPPKERDPAVKATLRNPKTGGVALLAWAVEGCLAWQRNGLRVPEIVTTATAEYRADMDPLKDFFDDRCEVPSAHWTATQAIMTGYRSWAENEGIRFPVSPKRMAQKLQDLGCEPERSSRARGWRGIRLLAPDEEPIGRAGNRFRDGCDTCDGSFRNSPHEGASLGKLPKALSQASQVSPLPMERPGNPSPKRIVEDRPFVLE